ncbi:MAG: hypothetical protein JWO92_2537 [Chitinophagaceae bacterium]|nr:hypothetical protein [Chitinophagaceae bacterium]
MLKVEIRTDINAKDYFPDSKHIIQYSFTLGERHYFRFDDPLNTPYDRALKCLVYYREMDMNCDRDFLKAHCDAIDNMLLKGKFTIQDLVTIKTLNDQLKQRLELPKEPDLLYKMASVVFFDNLENPTIYEFAYGERKIKFWKKNTTLTDFFLSMPLRQLIPYLEHAGENLLTFSEMIKTETKAHLATLSPLLSEEQNEILLGKLK